jgi:hypothetical protein
MSTEPESTSEQPENPVDTTEDENHPGKENEPERKESDHAATTHDSKNPVAAGSAVPLDSYFTVDNKTRQFIHSKLRAYESRRRSAFTAKLESSSLYWRSFRDLLAASIHETSRAERLVLGTARANATYADAMQASYEDTLIDDRGAMVLDQKKRNKLLVVRSGQDYAVAPTNVTGEGARTRNVALTEERRNNMLSRLIDSQQIVADKFGENSKQLESEIASELKHLRVDLENKFVAIREIGDAIISELEATEAEVSQAWGRFMSDLHTFLLFRIFGFT